MVNITENWLEMLADGAGAIRAIYGEKIPGLENLEIHELIIHHDGPRVSLRFDLPEFPVRPPKKWLAAGANKVQVVFLLVSVCDLKISGIKSNGKFNINLDKDGAHINLQGGGDEFEIFIKADFLMVNAISAYKDSAI
ncbi:Imm50 family immunity protein [Acidovorax sp. NCPPB 3576]|uniref:Imm50 family immunity protein n=1 Tax=Acidovorax sp. NCPPB 3576 TaxID=2940488 RepID=UPI00234BB761|nr:Imm50 family immunity protein [Acidovorax sp. NCPPB 3576]WCM88931.1 immunity 50 family protein [Acidovorax sp. NCPPB 3576]